MLYADEADNALIGGNDKVARKGPDDRTADGFDCLWRARTEEGRTTSMDHMTNRTPWGTPRKTDTDQIKIKLIEV